MVPHKTEYLSPAWNAVLVCLAGVCSDRPLLTLSESQLTSPPSSPCPGSVLWLRIPIFRAQATEAFPTPSRDESPCVRPRRAQQHVSRRVSSSGYHAVCPPCWAPGRQPPPENGCRAHQGSFQRALAHAGAPRMLTAFCA